MRKSMLITTSHFIQFSGCLDTEFVKVLRGSEEDRIEGDKLAGNKPVSFKYIQIH